MCVFSDRDQFRKFLGIWGRELAFVPIMDGEDHGVAAAGLGVRGELIMIRRTHDI
jgi:hypothetical protein